MRNGAREREKSRVARCFSPWRLALLVSFSRVRIRSARGGLIPRKFFALNVVRARDYFPLGNRVRVSFSMKG